MSSLLYRFSCGHVGRTNDSPNAKAQAFIRVAEVRGARVEEDRKPCPDCGGKGGRR